MISAIVQEGTGEKLEKQHYGGESENVGRTALAQEARADSVFPEKKSKKSDALSALEVGRQPRPSRVLKEHQSRLG